MAELLVCLQLLCVLHQAQMKPMTKERGKTMRIKHLKLDNFCSFYNGKAVDTDLYNKTEVSGCNESGKSTVKRAIFGY